MGLLSTFGDPGSAARDLLVAAGELVLGEMLPLVATSTPLGLVDLCIVWGETGVDGTEDSGCAALAYGKVIPATMENNLVYTFILLNSELENTTVSLLAAALGLRAGLPAPYF